MLSVVYGQSPIRKTSTSTSMIAIEFEVLSMVIACEKFTCILYIVNGASFKNKMRAANDDDVHVILV